MHRIPPASGQNWNNPLGLYQTVHRSSEADSPMPRMMAQGLGQPKPGNHPQNAVATILAFPLFPYESNFPCSIHHPLVTNSTVDELSAVDPRLIFLVLPIIHEDDVANSRGMFHLDKLHCSNLCCRHKLPFVPSIVHCWGVFHKNHKSDRILYWDSNQSKTKADNNCQEVCRDTVSVSWKGREMEPYWESWWVQRALY